jgi:hypothetical protein
MVAPEPGAQEQLKARDDWHDNIRHALRQLFHLCHPGFLLTCGSVLCMEGSCQFLFHGKRVFSSRRCCIVGTSSNDCADCRGH